MQVEHKLDGIYQIALKTKVAFGVGGILTLKDGHVSGSDAGYSWLGTYDVTNGKLTAVVTVSRDASEPVLNVFGDDKGFTLEIAGMLHDGDEISIVAHRSDIPQVELFGYLKPVKID